MPTIEAGASLGPYQVVERIGSGGMGDVYRAIDPRLGRQVAIKLLAARWVDNSSLRKRFEREARVISSINHPHICSIYDVGSQDGTDYLVMEHLEGETLAQRLAAGPLPPEEAIDRAIELAEALAHAHKRGVVHRDVKPGNVILTASGAKLLDFGLALLSENEGRASTAAALTSEMSFIGTIEYMAPEQLNGGTSDARTDIFALGIMLHEMLTGVRPFGGTTRASVIGTILFSAPDPLPPLDPSIDVSMQHLIGACLAKNPDDRIQTAHDVALQLRWMKEGAPAILPAGKTRIARKWLVAAALAVALSIVGGVAVVAKYTSRPRGHTEPLRFTLSSPTLAEELVWASLSPDGRLLALLVQTADEQRSLWVRPLHQTGARRLPVPDDVGQAFWSPESDAIGFASSHGLSIIPLNASSFRKLADAPAIRGAAWSPSGTILFAPDISTGLVAITSLDASPVPVTRVATTEGETTHRWPEFFEDGDHFLFVAGATKPGRAGLYVGSLKTKKVTRISSNTNRAIPVGEEILFVQDGSLYSQRFDLGGLRLTDRPRLLAEGVTVDTKLTGGSLVTATPGMIVFITAPVAANEFVWHDRKGNRIGSVALPLAQYKNPTLSPDERSLAVTRIDPLTGKDRVWTFDLQSGQGSRLIPDEANSDGAIWSWDGKRIYFSSDRNGRYDVYEKRLDAAAPARVVLQSRSFSEAVGDSPNGLLLHDRTAVEWQLLMLREGKEQQRVAVGDTGDTALSHDGRWMVFKSARLGAAGLDMFAQSTDDPGVRYHLDAEGATSPRFSAGSGELFYVDHERYLVSVPFGPPRVGPSKRLFRLNIGNAGYAGADYMPSRDGQRFLVNTKVDKGEHSVATIVVNWRESLQTR